MVDVTRFDHVAIAVEDLEPAIRLFHGVLGAQFVHGGDDDALGMRTVQLVLAPGTKVELMTPLTSTSYLRAYLDRHGPGFHHVTILVADVEAAIAELTAEGYQVVDTDLSAPKWRETFIRPSSGFGTLIQLADSTKEWTQPTTAYTLTDVMAGRVVWVDEEPVLRAWVDGAAG